MSGKEDYEVEALLGKRRRKGEVQYLVKWKGWDRPQDNSWEPLINLDCKDLVEDYEADRSKARAKPSEAEEQEKKIGRRRRRETPGQKRRAPPPRGFARGLTPEKVIGATPDLGELFLLVKVSTADFSHLTLKPKPDMKPQMSSLQFYANSPDPWKVI